MPRSRDRHSRGIRGPLVQQPPHSTRIRLQATRAQYFHQCVSDALDEISQFNPAALKEIVVGIEEVPTLHDMWDRVPMSAAVEPREGGQAQIVLFERPLERRAISRSDLRRLVHRTLVEQLSAITGLQTEALTDVDFDDWD